MWTSEVEDGVERRVKSINQFESAIEFIRYKPIPFKNIAVVSFFFCHSRAMEKLCFYCDSEDAVTSNNRTQWRWFLITKIIYHLLLEVLQLFLLLVYLFYKCKGNFTIIVIMKCCYEYRYYNSCGRKCMVSE